MSLCTSDCTLGMLSGLVAAANRRVENMGRTFNGGGSNTNIQTVLIVLVSLAILIAAGYFVFKWIKLREERGYHSPRRLLHELCRAHGLSAAQRQLLRDIATWHRLPNVLQIFIEPQLLQSPAMISALGSEAEIAALRAILFAKDGE